MNDTRDEWTRDREETEKERENEQIANEETERRNRGGTELRLTDPSGDTVRQQQQQSGTEIVGGVMTRPEWFYHWLIEYGGLHDREYNETILCMVTVEAHTS